MIYSFYYYVFIIEEKVQYVMYTFLSLHVYMINIWAIYVKQLSSDSSVCSVLGSPTSANALDGPTLFTSD